MNLQDEPAKVAGRVDTLNPTGGTAIAGRNEYLSRAVVKLEGDPVLVGADIMVENGPIEENIIPPSLNSTPATMYIPRLITLTVKAMPTGRHANMDGEGYEWSLGHFR